MRVLNQALNGNNSLIALLPVSCFLVVGGRAESICPSVDDCIEDKQTFVVMNRLHLHALSQHM